jgi:RHS repeat-associated protein
VVNYSRLPATDLISGWTDSISGASVSRSHEAHRDLLVAVTNSVGATMISAYDYANDALGRRTQRLDAGANAATNHFAYNVRSELTNAVMPVAGQGDQRYSWTLDQIGNRTATTHNDDVRTFAANELNQYTNIVADSVPAELRYDSDGNLTNDAVFAYTYNGENRLVLAEPLAPANGAKRVRNAYDHQGRRFEKVVDQWTGAAWAIVSTNRFVYDGWNVIAEYSHTPTPPYAHTNFYVRGLDLSGTLQGAGGIGGLLSIHTFAPLASFAVHCPFHDGNGNLVQTVDSNATVTASYVYDAYGATLTQAGPFADENPYRFSSQYFDAETALYMYIFRAYSPKLERWMNRDPIEEIGGGNLFAFAGNDALATVDIIGLVRVERIDHDVTYAMIRAGVLGWTDIRDRAYWMPPILETCKEPPCCRVKQKPSVKFIIDVYTLRSGKQSWKETAELGGVNYLGSNVYVGSSLAKLSHDHEQRRFDAWKEALQAYFGREFEDRVATLTATTCDELWKKIDDLTTKAADGWFTSADYAKAFSTQLEISEEKANTRRLSVDGFWGVYVEYELRSE